MKFEQMRRVVCGLVMGAAVAAAAPPVLVIALDAFRWDFAAREKAENLLALKSGGAAVERMTPSFPSTTFPNFHAMATGLEPARHGLVAMSFYDRAKGRGFYYTKNSREGEWYGGVPIWELAEAQGVKAATYFWPGTDAGVNGKYPSYYKQYDGRVPHEERVRQAVEWLEMPAGPGLVIVYFSDVDAAGHQHGPDSAEVKAAVKKVDATTGELVRRARAARPDVNIVVLSDHGQIAVESHIDLSGRADFKGCVAANEAPMTMLYCEDAERVRGELLKNAPEVEVYRREETPAHWRYRGNARIGDLVVVPKTASIVQVLVAGDGQKAVPPLKGMHGYDPQRWPEMRGMLIGVGPAFRRGARAEGVRNVDVFALLGRLLGVKLPAGVDADISRVEKLLK